MITSAIPAATHSHSAQQLQQLLQAQQAFFASGVTRSYAFRKGQLGVLRKALQRFEAALMEALYQDLRKGAFDAYGTELGIILKEISFTENRLKGWMRSQQRATPLLFFPTRSEVVLEPRGTALIIAPWNYPVMLLLKPLVSAIAAGNTVILKPSEQAPATEKVLVQMIQETFEEEYVAVVTGDGKWLSDHLISKHQLGLVFFTGSTATGRAVMQAAANQLTPVVLELGGKSPAIVAPDARLDYTARKVLFSKFMNAGQTCVSIDYLLVHESIKDKLVEKLKALLLTMYGPDASQSPDYGRIIHHRRYRTVAAYLKQGRILHGGDTNEADLYIGPTIMDQIPADAPLMQEEIFGPILPILTYNTIEEAKAIIQQHAQPLSLYVYTESRRTADAYMLGLQFGGGCVNNGLIHLGNPEIPFNGIGNSGLGMYHGYAGFQTFSHSKSIMRSSSWVDVPLWYPPYQPWYIKVLRKLMR